MGPMSPGGHLVTTAIAGGAVLASTGSIPLTAGGAMHLALDIGFNGRLTPRNIFAFYSFGFRWAHGFDALTLFGSEPRVTPAGFWGSFFLGPRLARPRVGHRAAVPYAPQG